MHIFPHAKHTYIKRQMHLHGIFDKVEAILRAL